MRIGIYYHARLYRELGGGTVFKETIIDEIGRIRNRHEVYLFSPTIPADLPKELADVPFIQVTRSKTRFFGKLVHALKQCSADGMAGLLESAHTYPSRLERAAKEHKIDLIWFISLDTERVTIPFIATVWDLEHRTHPYFPELSITDWTWEQRERHYRDLLPRAARVITGTQAGKREIVRFYQLPEEAVEVVPFPTSQFALHPGVEDGQDSAAAKLPESFLYYPAQFWPHKNHVGLLLALKIMREKHGLDFHLVLTGSDKGNLGHVQEKIKELGLSDRVISFGFVELGFLETLYRKAYALIFPSFLGPDNLPPLEAFALGCPVVASKVAGAEEQLGSAALLFDPKDPEEMALRIKELHDNPAKREEMIRLGRERALRWTSADYVERMAEIIDDFERVRRCWR